MILFDNLNITHIFLDTSPLIYYVEENPSYFLIVKTIFDYIDNGSLIAVTSPVTLAECLVGVYRSGLFQYKEDFLELIVYGSNVIFMPIDSEQAQQAGELRAKYNLTLTDAFQIATALSAGCEVFLTNDITLKRVTELNVLILDEIRNKKIR
ncbi:MAG: hypothetical protein QG641_156 [Candidatus Poribacteria bacterium]|nr:hypothetical protein [Candidatus Poribacteria bacterium]